jgi:Family of unknown function (DUF6113)
VNISRDSSAGRNTGSSSGSRAAVTAAGYVALVLLGGVQALIGAFQFSRGPAPLAAILFDAAILISCVLGSWGMRTALGAVLPAAGWVIVALVLTSVTASGSVIVTNTPAGMWFLYGGAVSAAAGAVYGAARWSRASRQRREADTRYRRSQR